MSKKLHIKDLLTFSLYDLLTMTNYFDINPRLSTSKVIDQLADKIIVKYHKAEMANISVKEEFSTALREGDVITVKRLLKNPKVDPADHTFRLPSEYGHADVVQLLLEDGRVDPTAKNNYAIVRSSQLGHAGVVQLLLADGRADPAVKNNYAIRWSSQNGHAGVVQLLLADGRADPTAENNIAIKESSRKGYTDVVKLLLADGRADPTAWDNAAIKASSYCGHADVVKLLLEDGRADPRAQLPVGWEYRKKEDEDEDEDED